MKNEIVSARGVYYDLEKSPYEYIDDFGKVYKFSSLKKLDMFNERIMEKETAWKKEVEKLGYKVTDTYFTNIKRLPELIYNAMIYK